MGDLPDERAGTAGANQAWTVVSLLFAGIVSWGGIGWLLDWWLGTKFFIPVGILLGSGCALYLVVRRYGHMTSDQD